jgi:hypothetical protein
MLATVQVEALDKARVDGPPVLGQDRLDGLTRTEYDAVFHPHDPPTPVGLHDLGIAQPRQGHPARLGLGAWAWRRSGWIHAPSCVTSAGRYARNPSVSNRGATARRQDLGDLMDQTVGYGQRALSHIHAQDTRANGGHRHPYPVRRARRALHSLGLGDVTVLDGPEPSAALVHLHLFDGDLTQVIAGERFDVLGRLDEPGQDRVRVGCKDSGDGTDAETRSESRDGPYPLVGIDLLGVKRRAVCLQEVPTTAQAMELAPPSAMGMAGGADGTETAPPRDTNRWHLGRSGHWDQPDGNDLR